MCVSTDGDPSACPPLIPPLQSPYSLIMSDNIPALLVADGKARRGTLVQVLVDGTWQKGPPPPVMPRGESFLRGGGHRWSGVIEQRVVLGRHSFWCPLAKGDGGCGGVCARVGGWVGETLQSLRDTLTTQHCGTREGCIFKLTADSN